MSSNGASTFGKEHGLVHEAVVTGRKAGADREFWKRLAHDVEFFRQLVQVHNGTREIAPLDNPLNHPDVVWISVAPNYYRSNQEAVKVLEDTRELYTNDGVVGIAARQHEGGVVRKEVALLPFDAIPERYRMHEDYISDDNLQRFLDDHNLVSEDLHTAAKVSEDNPALADEKPYGIHFQAQDGSWCWAEFRRSRGERRLFVDRCDSNWNSNWKHHYRFLVSRDFDS